MCTLLISFRQHRDYPLLIAANRDEFHERPTETLHWWPDYPDVLGGRDRQGGGTWFGIHRNGRFAALTNVRVFPLIPDAPSRGHLVNRFLLGEEDPEDYLDQLAESGPGYNGFNLLFGHSDALWYYSNKGGYPGRLQPGMYGLSNALLDVPWPKVQAARNTFHGLFEAEHPPHPETVFRELANKKQYPDDQLPDTGVGLEKERVLSALFIESPGYGTRASWYLRAAGNGETSVWERSYLPGKDSEVHFTRSI